MMNDGRGKDRIRISIGIISIVLIAAMMGLGITYGGTSGPSPIPPAPNFQVYSNVSILCAGYTNIVPVTIKNQGNPYLPAMQDVQIGLSNADTLQIGNSIEIPNIPVNTTSTVDIPLFVSASAGPIISVQVPITYNFLTLYSDNETRMISFGVRQCSQALSVNVTPTTFQVNQVDNITVTLMNLGNQTLRNISITAISPNTNRNGIRNVTTEVQFFGNQPVQIGSIGPGNTLTLEESMFENASGNTFPLNLSIMYYNGKYPEQKQANFLMLSSGAINMDTTSITTTPTNVTAGEIFSISFILTDIGTEGATAVTATPVFPAGFKTYGSSNSTFIGDIATDTQTPVTITLMSDAGVQSGVHQIPVKISYLNNLRQNLTTIIDVPVTIIGGSTSGSYPYATSANGINTQRIAFRRNNDSLYVEAILVVIIIGLGFLYFRARKRAQPKAQEKQRQRS